jgi:hypothetical protein
MDASDLISIKKARAQWATFKVEISIINTGCTNNTCATMLQPPCKVRYETYEQRENIRLGRAVCNCDCNTLTCYYKSTA